MKLFARLLRRSTATLIADPVQVELETTRRHLLAEVAKSSTLTAERDALAKRNEELQLFAGAALKGPNADEAQKLMNRIRLLEGRLAQTEAALADRSERVAIAERQSLSGQ